MSCQQSSSSSPARPTRVARAAVLVAAVLVGPAAAPVTAGELQLSGDRLEIPFSVAGGRPAIEVLIDGHGPYTFVLDTGAPVNMIDAQLAKNLGLVQVDETRPAAPGMPQGDPVPVVEAGVVSIGDADIAGERFVVLDVMTMSGGTWSGVLRFNAFRNGVITLDFPQQQLRFARGELEAGSNTISFDTNDAFIEIPVQLGEERLRAHIDSGSPGLIVVPRHLSGDLRFSEPPVKTGQIRVIGGSGDVFTARLDGSAKVGTIELTNPQIEIVDLALPVVNLGSRFLADLVVTVDQRNGLIRFDPTGSPPAHTERASSLPGQGPRRLGLRPKPAPPAANGLPLVDGHLQVDGVDPGSLAEAAGLRRGDLVAAVNGRPVAKYASGELLSLFASSETLHIDLVRDGEMIAVAID